MKKIVIVAGDKSADLYGGLLCKKLRKKFKRLEIYSFGGPHLAEYSQQRINLLKHSVSGIFEILAHLQDIFTTFNQTLKEINKIKPDLVILMDFPDFNLRLAKKINKKFPIFYYISPQVWAWRKTRVKQIKEYVKKMIVIFKFEEDFYRKQGMNVLYFGHPLLEVIKPQACEVEKIISLMPGSRKTEISHNLPIMLEAKKLIKGKLPDYAFRILRPPHIQESFYTELSSDMAVLPHSYQRVQESEFIITASGTATVEIAILEVPYLIMYKVNPLTFYVLQKMVDTKFIGMVNILSSKKIIEELLQNQANPEMIAQKTVEYLTDKDKYKRIKEDLKGVKEKLSPYGATQKIADFIGDYLGL